MTDQNRRTSLLGTLTICAAVVALISFLLPLYSVEFFGTHSVSGVEMVQEGFEYMDFPELGVSLSCLCSLIGVLFSLAAQKNPKCAICTAVASVVSMLLMLIAMTDDSSYLKSIDYAGMGFYVFMIMHIATLVLVVSKRYVSTGQQQTTVPTPNPKPVPEPADDYILCPHCGASIAKAAAFCRYCGQRMEKEEAIPPFLEPNPAPPPAPNLEETCPQCGTSVSKAAVFCRNCGLRIDKSSKKSSMGESAWYTPTDL